MLKLLCHQLGSEPPTDFVGDDFFLVGDNFYHILGSPTKYLLDVVHDLFEPTLGEALPQLRLQASAMPLQPSTDDLPSGDGFGFVSFMDLDGKAFL